MRRTLLAGVLAAATAFSGTVIAAVAPAAAAPPPQAQSAQATAIAAADAHIAANRAAFKLGGNDEVVQSSVTAGGNGLQYVGYERTHRGLPVVGGDFVVVTNASGAVVHTSVAQDRVLDVPTGTRVTAAQAATTSRARLARVDSAGTPRLVVLASGTPTTAWETQVSGAKADGSPSVQKVYVDANTGTVASSTELVREGQGKGSLVGDVTIDTSGSGSSYSMTDPNRSGIKCGGMNGSVYTGTDDNWGNGSGTDLETACVDSLYAAQREWDMLSQWLGRNGINGQGQGYPIRVGLNDVNAYWNGSYVQIGHNQANTQWIAAIDVVGHEFGHGIFQFTPGGAGNSGENGGINESTGDIFGALTEAFANNQSDPPDYEVGEEINLVGNGPIRYMYNPSKISGHPNCYNGNLDNTEVHAAAGPLNHWFYLLAEGSAPSGKPASPICSGGPSSVTGVGIRDAGKVYYNAMLSKTSSWRHPDIRKASLAAAKNLYSDCRVFDTVKAAWNAISVPAQSGEATCTAQNNDFSLAASPTSGSVQQGSSATVTINSSTTAGSAQNVSLSASGLPSGATASFSPTSITSGNSSTLTISTAASTPAGTYTVTVTGTGSVTRTTTYSLTVTTGGGGGPCSGTNDSDYTINDNATVDSEITISGCSTTPSSTSTVPVKIIHTYIGDLNVSLVAPDGTAYPLHSRTGGAADNIDQTYTVDLSSETANGTWKLRVQDAANGDTGRVDSWSLNLGGGGTPTNDFSVGLNPTSGSVERGKSLTATVNTTTTSGSAQNVSLSASGLPSGATASFSPTSVSTGNSATLTISTTSSVAAGTYNVTVSAAGNTTKTATYALTVTAPSTGGTIPDIDVANVKAHLTQLNQIASNNGGNRRSTSQGYRDSVAYVKGKLQNAGYTVSEQPCTSGCTSGAGPNLIAEWPGGDANNVYMFGAHLDGVSAGPGINDNGSGSSALLETALVLAQKNPTMTNKVRFGWWTDEEQGLNGSKFYVGQLSSTERSKIKAYYNFDMVGSPNGGYFINNINTTQSKYMKEYWDSKNLQPEENTEGQGRSDDASFKNAGIPSSGYAAGASYTKSSAQAQKWGGTSGQAYDRCYHSSCDTTSNINDSILNNSVDGIAYTLWKSAVGSAPANEFSLSLSPTSGSVERGNSASTTVSTQTTSGSAQNVSLSASGLPTGATASFNPSSVTSGNSSTLTISTTSSTPAGTYSVTVTGTGSTAKTATYSLTVTAPSSGGCNGGNQNDVNVPDRSSADSDITISGCSATPSATAQVPVKIVHTYIGDLVVSLIAPDGSVYVLQDKTGGATRNIDTTYTVNLSSETANGTWKLRVQDVYAGDTGYIDSWSLNLTPALRTGVTRTAS